MEYKIVLNATEKRMTVLYFRNQEGQSLDTLDQIRTHMFIRFNMV